MLCLTRRRDESIIIGDDIVITVIDIRGGNVRLGITARAETPVHRAEVKARLDAGEPPTRARQEWGR